MSLTELTIPKLRPGVHMDDRTPDFGIRVGKRRRTWIVVRGRGRVKTSIGHYPDLSLSEARKEAKKLLSTEPERTAPSITFAEARTRFIEASQPSKSARYVYNLKRCLEGHFAPLAMRQLADISHRDIEACLTRLSNRPSEQLHAFRYLRTFFNWTTKAPRRWLTVSPMQGYEPPGTDRRGTRILSDDELRRIWRAARKPAQAIFRLQICWGTRNTETCVLRPSWAVDGVMTIPGEFTKNGRDHAIPICPLAATLLPETNYEYFFPGRWGEGHINPGALGKLKREVMQESGTKGWQLRDLRRTFRSIAARVGVSREIAELLINHAPPILDDIYNRYDFLKEKREALLRIEAALVWLLARA